MKINKQEIKISDLKIKQGLIYTYNDLKNRNNRYVKGALFLNLIKQPNFKEIDSNIKENMHIINYPLYLTKTYSLENLKKIIDIQLMQNSEILIIPHFKEETDLIIKEKLNYLDNLSLRKPIIFEVHYNIEEDILSYLIENHKSYNILSIYYGVHYGQFPSISKINSLIYKFKEKVKNPIIINASPLMIAGPEARSSYLFPFWHLISEFWCKNWNAGGSGRDIKVVDYKDFKNKTYDEWLKTYSLNDIIPYIDLTVEEIFKNDTIAYKKRKEYKQQLLDELLIEINDILAHQLIDILLKFNLKQYDSMILNNYNLRYINFFIDTSLNYKFKDIEEEILFKNAFFRYLDPAVLNQKLNELNNLLIKKPAKNIFELIQHI